MVALVGESGCGKTTHGADRDPDGRERRRLDPVPRRRDRRPRCPRAAAVPARDPDHLPGSVRVARPPLHGARHDRGADPGPRARRARRTSAEAKVREAMERAGLTPPGALHRPLPARALGRPAAAGGDRGGARARAEAADRRRARLDARRLGPRGDPGAARRPAPGRDGRADDHARPLDRGALRRPDRRDVPRPDRRGGACAETLSATRSTRTRRR